MYMYMIDDLHQHYFTEHDVRQLIFYVNLMLIMFRISFSMQLLKLHKRVVRIIIHIAQPNAVNTL